VSLFVKKTYNNEKRLRLGNTTVATYKAGITCFTLVEVRGANIQNRLTITYRLTMSSGQVFMQFRIPEAVARQLIGLSTYNGMNLCKEIFTDQHFCFANGAAKLLRNSTIAGLIRKGKESELATDKNSSIHELQPREPPTK